MALVARIDRNKRFLRADRRVVFAALVAAILAAHLAAVDWAARQIASEPLLQRMRVPMFTRLLQPEAVTPPSAGRTRARVARSRPHATEATIAAPARSAASQAAKEAAEAQRLAHEAADVARAEDIARAAATARAAQDTQIAEQAALAAQALTAAASAAQASAIAASASAAASAASSAAAAIASWPSDTRLNYRLGGHFRSGPLYGSAHVQWLRQGERYETRIDIDLSPFTSLTLLSQGEVTPQGLSPTAYEELRRSGVRRNRMDANSVVLQDGRVVARPPNVQDTASQFVELGHRFASGQEALEVGKSVNVWLARPGGVDLWTYDIVEKEMLDAPQMGRIEAFHLKPRPIENPRGNIYPEMWFAPSLQYLPVRIRLTMGEEATVDLMVERIEQR